MQQSKYIVIVLSWLLAMSWFPAPVYSTEIVKFCYENKQFWPHFAQNSDNVPSEMPGAAIEILQQLDKQSPQLVFQFVRKPWLRCLQDLQNNQVQAVIGSYDPEREVFAQYPMRQGKPDHQQAFSQVSSCLYADNKAPIIWDGKRLSTIEQQPVSVAIPNGYSIRKLFEKQEFIIYTTYSIEKSHQLLFNGRVQASVGRCNLINMPKNIQKLSPQLSTKYGYLIFSKKYYRQHSTLVNRLWRNQSNIDKAAIYARYPSQPPKQK